MGATPVLAGGAKRGTEAEVVGAAGIVPAGEVLGKKGGYSGTLMVGSKNPGWGAPLTLFNSSPAEPSPEHNKKLLLYLIITFF